MSDADVRLVGVPVRGPVWTRGLDEPDFLVPAKPKDAPRIAVFGLADVRGDGGALGLTLYLAEALALRTRAEAWAVIPVLHGSALALATSPWSAEQATAACAAVRPDVVVTGSLDPDVLVLRAHRKSTLLCETRLGRDVGSAALCTAASEELARVLDLALQKGVALRDDETATEYLAALGTVFAHHAAAAGLIGTGALFDEAGRLEACLRLHVTMRSEVSTAIVASALLAARRHGSRAAASLLPELTRLLAAPEARRLAPVVARLLGDAAPQPV
jgi:hypothetical protein